MLAPVVNESVEGVRLGGLPETVRLLIVALLQGFKKARHRALLPKIPETKTQKAANNGEQKYHENQSLKRNMLTETSDRLGRLGIE